MRFFTILFMLFVSLFLNSCFLVLDFDKKKTDSLCGDGVVDVDYGEECDSSDLNGQTCQDRGFAGGTLQCDSTCDINTSQCTDIGCGDGVRNGDEECDLGDLNGQTCVSRGFVGGDLACDSDCSFDTTGCYYDPTCGDGIVNSGEEECDLGDLNNETCETLGYGSGDLQCDIDACRFDTAECSQPCTIDYIYADSDNTCGSGEECTIVDPSDTGNADCVTKSGENFQYYYPCASGDCIKGSSCLDLLGFGTTCVPFTREGSPFPFVGQGGGELECPPLLDADLNMYGFGTSFGYGSGNPLWICITIDCNLANFSSECGYSAGTGLGCYNVGQMLGDGIDHTMCLPAGTGYTGAHCDKVNDCAPGFFCVNNTCVSN